MAQTAVFSSDLALPLGNLGFFTWVVSENRIYGDTVFADLYEIAHEQVVEGVPVELILERISDEDRQVMAASIHSGIVTGKASMSEYSVTGPSGHRKKLLAFGRCFQDADGIPSFYTGAVTLSHPSRTPKAATPLEAHCRIALEMAQEQGSDLAARYLSSAIGALGLGGGAVR